MNYSLLTPSRNCRQNITYLVWRNIYNSSRLRSYIKNHYEVLNLTRDCSSKDIRDAFIILSKKYHPDKNKDNPKAQEQFVRISEAYNVLIKPVSRRDYDCRLRNIAMDQEYRSGNNQQYYDAHRYSHKSNYNNPWNDPSFARNRRFNEEESEDRYYGIKGIKKMTNVELLFWLTNSLFIAFFIFSSAARFTGLSNLDKMRESSEANRLYLQRVRERAEFLSSREQQMEELIRRTNPPPPTMDPLPKT